MKVIVTGGAGFIGSNLVQVLVDKGFQVTIIDNFSSGSYENIAEFQDRITVINADISVSDGWEEALLDSDFVVHLAALAEIVPSIKKPTKYFQANVTGTLNLLEGLRKAKIKKLIYAASSSCYGLPKRFPTNEESEFSPQYPYALTKLLGEQLVQHWSQLYGIPSISLRFFNVYGPKARTSGSYGAVLGVFLAQKLANKPLTVVGTGKQTRDFTYVSDISAAILVSLFDLNKRYRYYNVGSGATISVNRLASLVGGLTVSIPKRPGEPDCTFADISKIKNELGWQPKVSVEEGMKLLLKNTKHWERAPVWDPESIAIATKDWFKYLG